MLAFPSLEWARAFRQAVNERDEFRRKASGLTADFVFHVKPDERWDRDYLVRVRVDDGECVAVEEIAHVPTTDADFTFRGTYGEWARILQGEVDPIQAVLTRRLELRGNVARLVRYAGAAKELASATRDVPTRFV